MGCAYILVNTRIIPDSRQSTVNGYLVKLARESRKISIEELAKKTNERVDYWREIELGIRIAIEKDLNSIEFLDYPREFYYRQTELLDTPNRIFVCGDGVQPCHSCGKVADWLCDYPVGVGKTCDLPICDQCRTHVGIYDFCPIHQESNKLIMRL